MVMVDLEIEAETELIGKVENLALKYFGDTSDVSKGRVLEVGFRIRRLWSQLVESCGKEVDEPTYRLKEAERTPFWSGFWRNV